MSALKQNRRCVFCCLVLTHNYRTICTRQAAVTTITSCLAWCWMINGTPRSRSSAPSTWPASGSCSTARTSPGTSSGKGGNEISRSTARYFCLQRISVPRRPAAAAAQRQGRGGRRHHLRQRRPRLRHRQPPDQHLQQPHEEECEPVRDQQEEGEVQGCGGGCWVRGPERPGRPQHLGARPEDSAGD